MQPRSWSPFSFFLCSYFPERVVASCCFGLKILSVYSPCTVQQWTFLPHNLWRILVIFSLQKCPCPLLSLFHLSVSAQSFAFFFNLLTVFLHPPSHTNFLSNTEQEKDFRSKFTGRKHREQSPHISSTQPNALCFSCHFSPFRFHQILSICTGLKCEPDTFNCT